MQNKSLRKAIGDTRAIRAMVSNSLRSISMGRSQHIAGAGSGTPVVQYAGSSSFPRLEGKPYLKTGFSNGRGFSITLYTPSTLYISVGSDWDVTAPAGMHFKWQPNIGIAVIRDSDGMDYHPTKDDFRASNFATRVRKSMSANYRNRIEARKAAKIAASQRAMFERQSATTRVTLHDSRVAGNCIEGTLSFAERKLGLTREEVLRAGHLFSVPASQLLRVANGDAERVEAAIKVAWMRETMVQI